MGDDVYLVPRRVEGEIVIGATAEDAGFDLSVHADAIATLHASAISICPDLEHATVVRTWAGIRPATPDMLPIIGPDPDAPSLLYACGHSKNGILLAPMTARCIAARLLDLPSDVDASPFSIERFSGTQSPTGNH
jgi:glycine oxidase